jgi:hypothetical protein
VGSTSSATSTSSRPSPSPWSAPSTCKCRAAFAGILQLEGESSYRQLIPARSWRVGGLPASPRRRRFSRSERPLPPIFRPRAEIPHLRSLLFCSLSPVFSHYG